MENVQKITQARFLNESDNVEQMYADGFANVVFSPSNCKIDLFQVVKREEDMEVRKIVSTLVIPSVALVEMCHNILTKFGHVREPLDQAFEQQRLSFAQYLPNVVNDEVK